MAAFPTKKSPPVRATPEVEVYAAEVTGVGSMAGTTICCQMCSGPRRRPASTSSEGVLVRICFGKIGRDAGHGAEAGQVRGGRGAPCHHQLRQLLHRGRRRQERHLVDQRLVEQRGVFGLQQGNGRADVAYVGVATFSRDRQVWEEPARVQPRGGDGPEHGQTLAVAELATPGGLTAGLPSLWGALSPGAPLSLHPTVVLGPRLTP